jgi:endonuclease/exonuclease/phosphatase (EEP) superfamily protein YafD
VTAERVAVGTEESAPAVEETRKPLRRRGWVTWVVLGAAGSWLAFVAAHRVLSGRVWWWNLPDLAPPPVFLAIPVLLLAVVPLARRARWVGATVALAAMTLGWPCAGVNLATLWYEPPPAPPDAITVFSWNTWYWDELVRTGPGDEQIHDADAFYRYLHAQKADVYLLQEYLYMERPDFTPLPVADPDRLRREFPGFHIALSGELVTVSRFPIVLERPLDLRPWLHRQWPDLPPADSQLPAYHTVKTLRTDVMIAGQVVSFYNAHLLVPITGLPARTGDTAWDSLARYDMRAANFRALAADVAGNPHSILLAGDLNTSPAMRLLRTLPDRLIDASPALDSLYPGSWARFGLWLWRIDWVFTTTDVEVHRYRMVPQGDESDHSGQLVVMSISDCRERTPCR